MDVRMPNTFTGGVTPNIATAFTVAEDLACPGPLHLGVTLLGDPVGTG